MLIADTIVGSFLKRGISNKLDRSEDHLINIRGLADYEMTAPEYEFHLLSDEKSDESEMSYDEGNPDESSSSENSTAENNFPEKVVIVKEN